MSNVVTTYFTELSNQTGAAWNRFWFEPSHPATVSALRIVAGVATLCYLLSATTELVNLFAADGLLPNAAVITAMRQRPDIPNIRFSLLYYLNEPAMLWIFHAVSIGVAAAFTAGLFTRITNVLSLVIMLSWVHRAPMLTGLFEPLLTMLLLYLCLAPSGACYSLDSRRKSQPLQFSWLATVSIRLLQVHLCLFYLMFALTKLGGQVWWGGGAVYLMMAQSESRLVDLTFLRSSIFAINVWTHAIVLFEFAYAILIWQRILRPLLMGLSVLMWLSAGLLTGQVEFALLMIALNLAFIPGTWLATCCRSQGEPTTATP